MYNYSVVIPHFNTPKLLQRLLNSIPDRDDLEIIVVDDNSNNVDFNDFPGIGKTNCKVIFDKKGGGGGYARNIGLEEATGKWVLFADSDDFFNYCVNDILDEYVNDEADIVFFKANSMDSDDYSMSDRGNDRLNYYIDCYDEDQLLYGNYLKYRCGEPWGKLIKKSVIDTNHINFEETIIHNDHRFSYVLGYYSKEIKVDRRALYCVTTRKGSTSKNVSDDAILTRIRVFGEADLFFRKHQIPVEYMLDWHISQLAQLYMNKQDGLFKKGCEILLSLGLDKDELNRSLYYSIQTQKYKSDNWMWRHSCIVRKVCRKLNKVIVFRVRDIFNSYPSYM